MTSRTDAAGLALRLARLLGNEGHPIVIVAMDHGLAGVPTGFSEPDETIAKVVAARPDGLLLGVGLARRMAHMLSCGRGQGLVVAVDQVMHWPPGGPAVVHSPTFSVEDAVRLGADAVKTMLLLGRDDPADELRNQRYIADVAEACRGWEMPLMVEPYLQGPKVPTNSAERAQLAWDGARIGLELGADLIKVEYGQEPDAFRALVESSPVPVLVLGGSRRSSARALLTEVIAAADAGAAGVTIGRNVWQRPDPGQMVRALAVALSTRNVDLATAELGEEDREATG